MMDTDQIKKEASRRLVLILSELNLGDFFQLCPFVQAKVYNTIRFSIKEDFLIGEKYNQTINNLVQQTLWPTVEGILH